jgi:competence protein ComEC
VSYDVELSGVEYEGQFVPASGGLRLGYIARAEDTFCSMTCRGESLWPEISPVKAAVAAKNNDSLVLRLKYRNRTLLLPGDAEKQAEYAMLEEHSDGLHADVLKVGHHGSKTSTTQEFLDTVTPAIAIISAGEDDPYGHPSPELLERLEASGARVLRTDRDGAVLLSRTATD